MDAAGAGWGDEDDLDLGGDGEAGEDDDGLGMEDVDGFPKGSDDEEGGWEMEDLDLPTDIGGDESFTGTGKSQFVAPTAGVPPQQRWQQKCNLAGEQVAAGSFDTAMRLLNRQLGIVNFAPLKSMFLETHQAAFGSLPGLPGLPTLSIALDRNWDPDASTQQPTAPVLIYRWVWPFLQGCFAWACGPVLELCGLARLSRACAWHVCAACPSWRMP